MIETCDDETLDLLKKNNMKIFQKKNGFRFSVDAVLIAKFFKPSKKGVVVDFGTGTGIIPLLISDNQRINKIYGVEIQKNIYEMAKKSVEINGCGDKIEIVNCDINNIEEIFSKDSVDYIISNPPYFSLNGGTLSKSETKKISRHESNIDMDTLIYKAKRILKSCGTISFIYKTERLQEIIVILNKYLFNIHRIRFVHTQEDKKASLVLIEAVKEKKKAIIIEPPMIIEKKSGEYTDEYNEYYL